MTQVFRSQFTRIKDLSDRRRLPRLGKVRLGVKMISQKTGKEYPRETSYFVCPPEVQKIYGEQPTELEVMFPINDIDTVFPQRYAWFGSSKGIKCIGDGERAMRIEEPDGKRYPEMVERECPCELLDHGCSKRAHLLIMLPKVNVGGIYQIDIGSYNSIIDINSGLDYVQALVGRFSMVPLKLKRVPRETHGSGKKETHYTLMVFLEGDLNFINVLRDSTNRVLSGPKYALPAPVIENPAMDEGAVVEVEEEEPESPPMTEEQVVEDLKAMGMVEEVPPVTEDVLLKNWHKEVNLMPDFKTVNEFFSQNCIPIKRQLSEENYETFVSMVNDRLKSLKGKKR